MRLSNTIATLAAASLASAKNILLTNDDGWASTGIRATYRDLTAAGHNVLLVAPVEQRSGYGGTLQFTYANTLFHDDQFGYKKAGDPAWGHEVSDDHIWYFNGTPAACVAFAFDYLLPSTFANASIDLVVSGPNEGLNQDALYTLSGTIGATYNAVYRGYPAIGVSGSNTNNTFFQDSLNDDASNPWNIYAGKIVDLVSTLFAAQGDNDRLLPLGTGLNVNMPLVGSDDESCTDPAFIFGRLTGSETVTAGLSYNSTSDEFAFTYKPALGVSVVYHGDGTLESEESILNNHECTSDVSLFSVDYTANSEQEHQVQAMLTSLLSA